MNYKLDLKNVSYIYGEKTPFRVDALKNIELNIVSGSITGIIGHTGSGKSTLVKLLNGLERPTTGMVLLDGDDIWDKPREIGKIRFRVGLVMQYPEYQLFEETVFEDIAYGPRNMGLPEDEIEARVTECVRLVGLDEELLERSPFELSGGQKRRVAIAGIMAMRPEVLILDEPAAGLDPEGRSIIFSAIQKYKDTENATVIIVSHSMEDMARYCDRIAVLEHGNLLCEGDKDHIFSDPDLLIDAGLDIPEITYLIKLLSDRGIVCDKPIYTVDAAYDFVMNKLGGGQIQ